MSRMAATSSTPPESPSPVRGRIAFEVVDRVLIMRIENPTKANALTAAMLSQLGERLSAARSSEVGAAILTGCGDRHFSSGADLGTDTPPEWVARIGHIEDGIQAVADAIADAPFPTIAALNGDTIGGGLDLAMACDWRLAGDDITLRMPPARLGLVYRAQGMRRFVGEIGMARTREMFFTGRSYDAATAQTIGLVTDLHPRHDLLPATLEIARGIARNAPIAVEGMRRTLAAIPTDGRSDPDVEAWRQRAFESQDLIEGVSAVRQRRQPDFRGI